MENETSASTNHTSLHRWLACILAAAAIFTGWFIPEFYDWTGMDQSRPAAIVGWIALSILVGDVLLIAFIVKLHLSKTADPVVVPAAIPQRWRFSMLQILQVITGTAILLTIARLTSPRIACFLLQGLVVIAGIWTGVRFPWTRWRIAWLVVVQIAPLLWITRQSGLLEYPILFAMLNLSAMLPAAWIVQPNNQNAVWVFTLITTLEIASGIWLSYLGPKRSLVFGIVLLTLSMFGSFAFNAAMRA